MTEPVVSGSYAEVYHTRECQSWPEKSVPLSEVEGDGRDRRECSHCAGSVTGPSCPFCGTPVTSNLAQHLDGCPMREVAKATIERRAQEIRAARR